MKKFFFSFDFSLQYFSLRLKTVWFLERANKSHKNERNSYYRGRFCDCVHVSMFNEQFCVSVESTQHFMDSIEKLFWEIYAAYLIIGGQLAKTLLSFWLCETTRMITGTSAAQFNLRKTIEDHLVRS